MQRRNFKSVLLFIIILILPAFPGSGFIDRWIHPLEPSGKHYKTLAELSEEPDTSKINLDNIQYPWSEYSKGALANSLMRTYYLSKTDELELAAIVKFPANSSSQTHKELEFLKNLENARTAEEIKRAEYIAEIGSWQISSTRQSRVTKKI